uniref:Mon2 C-terminal domain-containing protein n=1 Tax=Timema cristinae TaxID=61476 RepID=A0A7R9D4X0_TIMCR|nr:unnamed protein product [Timema cristinae]
MSCGRDFGIIDKRRRKFQVMVPEELKYVVESARVKNPFKLVSMEQNDFIYFSSVANESTNTSKLDISKASHIKISSSKPHLVKVATNIGLNPEWVSLAALKAFQEILYLNKGSDGNLTSGVTVSASEETDIWGVAWKVWLRIGEESTTPTSEVDTRDDLYIPSQPFLTALIQIFPAVFQHITAKFTPSDLQKLCNVLQNTVAVPVHGEASPFIIPLTDVVLTQLQDGVVHCMKLLEKEALAGPNNMKTMISPTFHQLLEFSKFACEAPPYGNIDSKSVSQVRGSYFDWVAVNYVPFGEKALTMVVNLYQRTASDMSVIQASILHSIINARTTGGREGKGESCFENILKHAPRLQRRAKEQFYELAERG